MRVLKRKPINWEYLIKRYPLQIVCPMATYFVEILKLPLLNYISLSNLNGDVNRYLGHPGSVVGKPVNVNPGLNVI